MENRFVIQNLSYFQEVDISFIKKKCYTVLNQNINYNAVSTRFNISHQKNWGGL